MAVTAFWKHCKNWHISAIYCKNCCFWRGLICGALWLLRAFGVCEYGRTGERLTRGVFGGFLWCLCACGVRSGCGVGVGLRLWLENSACVGLSGLGAYSRLGLGLSCALRLFLGLGLLVRDALRSDALRGDARTVGAFGITRRMARTVNAWRGARGSETGRGGVPTPIWKGGNFFICYPALPKLKIFLWNTYW